jgi:hypothetical protein
MTRHSSDYCGPSRSPALPNRFQLLVACRIQFDPGCLYNNLGQVSRPLAWNRGIHRKFWNGAWGHWKAVEDEAAITSDHRRMQEPLSRMAEASNKPDYLLSNVSFFF